MLITCVQACHGRQKTRNQAVGGCKSRCLDSSPYRARILPGCICRKMGQMRRPFLRRCAEDGIARNSLEFCWRRCWRTRWSDLWQPATVAPCPRFAIDTLQYLFKQLWRPTVHSTPERSKSFAEDWEPCFIPRVAGSCCYSTQSASSGRTCSCSMYYLEYVEGVKTSDQTHQTVDGAKTNSWNGKGSGRL